ncbi:hypothetical protein ACHQM5_020670 [Ranunculus cassubicifolius]
MKFSEIAIVFCNQIDFQAGCHLLNNMLAMVLLMRLGTFQLFRESLRSGGRHSNKSWHDFFPMLPPSWDALFLLLVLPDIHIGLLVLIIISF